MGSNSVDEWIEDKLKEGADKEAVKQVIQEKGYNPVKVDEISNRVSLNHSDSLENDNSPKSRDKIEKRRKSIKQGSSQDTGFNQGQPSKSRSEGSISKGNSDIDDSTEDVKNSQKSSDTVSEAKKFIGEKTYLLKYIAVFIVSMSLGIVLGNLVFS